jgi:hypothetical protein
MMQLQGKAKGAEPISAPFAFEDRFYLAGRFLKRFRLCIKMGIITMIKINTPIRTIPFVFPAWATSGMGVGLVFPGVAMIVAVTGEIRVGLIFPGVAVEVEVATCESVGAGESAMLDSENRKKILSKTITGMRIFLSIILLTKKGDEVSP